MAHYFLLVLGFFVAATQAAVLSFWQENSTEIADSARATLNRDTRYDRWLDAKRVLYRFDPISYSGEEKSLIMTAMSQIAADMNKCISFQEYNADSDAGLDNIYISKTLNDGTIPATCFTFYGRLLRAAGQGQKMAIHDGPNGCMDNVREVMKILVNVLGLRNEYNRPDRDQHLKVFVENLQPELRFSNLLNPYNASQVLRSGPFDYHSITIPQPSQYAIAGKHIYEFPADKAVPTLAHLSKADCAGLSFMYGCDESKCVDFYPEAKPVEASTEASTTVTATSAATTEAATTEAATTQAATEASTEAATTIAVTTEAASTEASSVATTEEAKMEKMAAVEVAAVVTAAEVSEASVQAAQPANLVAETSAATSEVSTEASTEAATTEAATTVEVSTAAASTEATSTVPTLNVTLVDIIVPRKGAEEVKEPAAVVVVNAVTEASSTAASAPTDAATTVAAEVEETTASNPSVKLVVIAAMTDSSAAPAVTSENTTMAATSEASSTEAMTTGAAAQETTAEVTTVATSEASSSVSVEGSTAAIANATIVV
ncbi:hypothetical protein RvY_04544 [Ramazzottius varieornatus]|uniref:Peptidase M12A domain-containing protein n=1 Tax=Ramazzottius varieornatus TaxID=947166 RepID=A0A1D1UYP5_RAMVA|nr:hypothetical protein RvY_04544 [Ramazzottius varieornatus]